MCFSLQTLCVCKYMCHIYICVCVFVCVILGNINIVLIFSVSLLENDGAFSTCKVVSDLAAIFHRFRLEFNEKLGRFYLKFYLKFKHHVLCTHVSYHSGKEQLKISFYKYSQWYSKNLKEETNSTQNLNLMFVTR